MQKIRLAAAGLTVMMAVAAGPAPKMPSEADFIREVARFAASSATATNDMARGLLRVQRAQDLCDDVGLVASKGAVSDWTGVVTVLDTTDDGRGILEIRISDQITVGTANNRLSESLLSTPTLIPTNSQVYNVAVGLTKGQNVRFSGNFLPSKTDCAQETSLTVSGSLTEPSYLFRFTKLSAVPQ